MIMPQEIKDKWVAALRSGDYKQARGILWDKISGGYCCLGVLQKVCDDKVEGGGFPSGNWFNSHHIVLDNPIKKFVSVDDDNICGHLVLMNDGDRLGLTKSFPEIADWIEKNVGVTTGE